MKEIKTCPEWAFFGGQGTRFPVLNEGIWECDAETSRWDYSRTGDCESWTFAIIAHKVGTAGNAFKEGVFFAHEERDNDGERLFVNMTPYAWGRDVSEAWEEVCS